MDSVLSLRVRFWAWLNIIVQLVFPLAVVFTPTIAKADDIKSSAPRIERILPAITELPGEVSVDQDQQARKIAGYASQTGSFLTSRPNGQAAAAMVRGMATTAASAEIQQWLGQFGTARVQLDANQRFSLKNSQFELLLPIYDQGDNLVFTQGSLQRTDGRAQTSLGVGIRHVTPTYMLGGNLFGDYDLSRDHARIGGGLEYWRDYIKFGANGYLRLTDWKNSPDLTDYEERPANGWDLRAQAWLPWLPLLGGKLTYEKYYGHEVALLGVNNRQRNPDVITAGVNYTPVPLITLGLERRMEHDGKNDTSFTLGINYQWGVPWRSQLDASAVAGMRSLAGSRHELVDRNNNIVLEYRKKNVIRLYTADRVTGLPHEQKSLGVSVHSLHGLARLDWDASDFISSGGSLVKKAGDWVVTLPPYQSEAAGINTYSISGVAVDVKGNRTDRSVTQVTVQEPQRSFGKPAQEKSSVATDKSRYMVGEEITVSVVLKDNNDKGVSGFSLTAENVTVPNATLTSDWADNGGGRYRALYRAATTSTGLKAELKLPDWKQASTTDAYTITSDGIPVQVFSTVETAEEEASVRKGRSVSRGKRHKSGKVFVVAVTLKDADGNPVTGYALPADSVTVPNATLKSGWTDKGDGTYRAKYRSGKAGKGLKARLKLAIWSQASESSEYAVDAGDAVQAKSTVATDKAGYTSGDSMVVTVMLKDEEGNTVSGETLTAEAVKVANATLSGSWSDKGNGTYRATWTATMAGSGLKATLKLVDWARASESGTYSVAAGKAVQANSAITTDKTAYMAGDSIKISVSLRDADKNAVSGVVLADEVAVANATLKSVWTDNKDGTYSATYTAAKAGSGLKATLKLADWARASESGTYSVAAGKVVQANSAITTDKTAYMAGDSIKISVSLRDADKNAVSGVVLADEVAVANATLKSVWTDNKDGTYSATYTAAKAGSGLKATLKLAGWARASESGTYSVAAGKVVQINSTITTDKTAYMAGDSIKISVSLKDADNNAVSGVTLSAEVVTVVNARLTGSWTDNKDGTYTATYTATRAGVGLKATLKLKEWSKPSESAAWSISAGEIKKGTFSADKQQVEADGKDMVTLTAYLEDGYGNPVSGKTVNIKGAETLYGFTLQPVSDKQNGRYTAIATTTTRGEVKLYAEVDNKTVGEAVTVKGVLRPALKFTSPELNTPWTRNYNSQSVSGVPKGVEQRWSVSDSSVATVDNTGKLRLLKAGETKVTVITAENGQYDPASASYRLRVSKANPGLRITRGNEKITATWKDGVARSIATPVFDNADVEDSLTPVYKSQNTDIVSVDQSRNLIGVKPGQTVITISTPETEQFSASSGGVDFILNKATPGIRFVKAQVEMTDKSTFTLQKPEITLPSGNGGTVVSNAVPVELRSQWKSDNTKVVDITAAGTLKRSPAKGRAQLTFTTLANDYYKAASADYIQMVYTTPAITLKVNRTSKGVESLRDVWTPVYTDDTLSAVWNFDSEPYGKVKTAIITFKDSSGKLLATEEVKSPPAGERTTTIRPTTSLWGKKVTVEVSAKGYGELSSRSSSTVEVRNLAPNQIWQKSSVSYLVTGVGRFTHIDSGDFNKKISGALKVELPKDKTLLSPMDIILEGIKTNGNVGDYGVYDHFKISQGVHNKDYSSVIKYGLWQDHWGNFTLELKVNYANQRYVYRTPDQAWTANGSQISYTKTTEW